MLVPIKWLYEFVPCDKPAKELAELFTNKGVEVKNITRGGEKLEGFITAEVKTIENNKVTLFDGKNTCQITTITDRLKTGDKIGYNPKNSTWLNPLLIEISEDTLPYVLSTEYKAGTPILNYFDDYVLDLEILPNRGDLMSIIGVARELASYEEIKAEFCESHPLFGKEPIRNVFCESHPLFGKENEKYEVKQLLNLQVLNKDACPDYIARVIFDTKIGPSPFWLQWRLISAGLRPINNVVDATNYIMIKYGTPLHAFDYDKITDKTLQVRFANKGEKIKTIDGEIRTLNEKVLVIADNKYTIALAGIMGGTDTEISNSTKNVVLECARFDSKSIRHGSKKTNLSTSASQRFEMGSNSEILENACYEVSNLIAELGNGVVAKGKLEVRTEDQPVTIKLDSEKINRLLGVDLKRDWIKAILTKINCIVTEENSIFNVKIPSYRLDLRRDVDLIEEIGRIYGYDKLPSLFSLRGSQPGSVDSLSIELSKIRDFFVGFSFVENYTISFCDEEAAMGFTNAGVIKIPNPLNERFAVLRPSILATLLDSVKTNYSRGNKNLRLFEIGKTFNLANEPRERLHIAAVIVGENAPIFWKETKISNADYFDIKGVAESFLDFLKVKDITFQVTNLKFLNINNAVSLKYADKEIGHLGEIKKQILDRYNIPVPVYTLEINLEELLKLAPSYRLFQSLPRFPSIIRDFAFIVDDKVPVAKLTQVIEKITGALLESIEVFDYFEGKPLALGKRNLGIRIALRSEERTLNQIEVNKLFERILNFLKDEMQVELRGESGS